MTHKTCGIRGFGDPDSIEEALTASLKHTQVPAGPPKDIPDECHGAWRRVQIASRRATTLATQDRHIAAAYYDAASRVAGEEAYACVQGRRVDSTLRTLYDELVGQAHRWAEGK